MNTKLDNTKRMQELAGLHKEVESSFLLNDDIIYDKMLNMDQEQLVSSILEFAENNPEVKLIDYLNSEWGTSEED